MSTSVYGREFVEEIRRRVEPVLTRGQLRYLDDNFFIQHSASRPAELKRDRKRAIALAVDEKTRNGMVRKAAYSEVSEDIGLKADAENGPVAKYYRAYVQEIETEAWIYWHLNEGYRAATE